MAGTDDGNSPFWSPDSRALGFFSLDSLKRVDLSGGQPRTLARSVGGGMGGSRNRDGTIIFHQRGALGAPIERVSENGGPTAPVTPADPRQPLLTFPQFLQDGRHFLYYGAFGSEPGVYADALDRSDPNRRVDNTGPSGGLVNAAIFTYAAGYLLVNRQGTLFGRRFDPDHQTLSGDCHSAHFSMIGLPTADSFCIKPAT